MIRTIRINDFERDRRLPFRGTWLRDGNSNRNRRHSPGGMIDEGTAIQKSELSEQHSTDEGYRRELLEVDLHREFILLLLHHEGHLTEARTPHLEFRRASPRFCPPCSQTPDDPETIRVSLTVDVALGPRARKSLRTFVYKTHRSLVGVMPLSRSAIARARARANARWLKTRDSHHQENSPSRETASRERMRRSRRARDVVVASDPPLRGLIDVAPEFKRSRCRRRVRSPSSSSELQTKTFLFITHPHSEKTRATRDRKRKEKRLTCCAETNDVCRARDSFKEQ